MKPNPAWPRILVAVAIASGLSSPSRVVAESLAVVSAGKAAAAKVTGAPWESSEHGLTAEGTGRFLHAKKALGTGDFRVTARITLARLDGSAASFEIANGRFGFDGRGGTMFAEGGLFKDGAKSLGRASDFLKPGEPFVFEAVRENGVTRFLIGGKDVLRQEGWNGPAGRVGFRPWRNRMTVQDFAIEGALIEPPPPPSPLFLSGHAGGTDGYHTYRIPALCVTKSGTVLALCEGRKDSWNDSGNIDLLLKRSTDQGKTWSAQQVVWDDAGHTCGNPCVVVDRETGTLFLLGTWNRGDDHEGGIIAGTSKDTRRVFVMRSTDDGLTWSHPQEITAEVKKPGWTWYATGPGSGLQIEHGPRKGRLVIPCDHIEAESKRYYSHVIYSDNHGTSWKLGGTTPQDKVNECEVVELTGGKLMLNMRNYDRSQRNRQTALSDDGGLTWHTQKHDAGLIEPICQAALERLKWPQDDQPGVILFSNPASTSARVRMTVRASFDDGLTWPNLKLLFDGPGGYSDLAVFSDGRIGCLYEGGRENIAESIIFTAFSLQDLEKAGD